MRMKNPAHPGEIIKASLDEIEVTTAEAARALGVSRQQLHKVISGKSAVSAEMAVRLEKGLGSTAEFWLRLQASYDLAQALDRADQLEVDPLVPKAAAE
jgi:addiction module HigA family antidote